MRQAAGRRAVGTDERRYVLGGWQQLGRRRVVSEGRDAGGRALAAEKGEADKRHGGQVTHALWQEARQWDGRVPRRHVLGSGWQQ